MNNQMPDWLLLPLLPLLYGGWPVVFIVYFYRHRHRPAWLSVALTVVLTLGVCVVSGIVTKLAISQIPQGRTPPGAIAQVVLQTVVLSPWLAAYLVLAFWGIRALRKRREIQSQPSDEPNGASPRRLS
jgi:hypothetical protein